MRAAVGMLVTWVMGCVAAYGQAASKRLEFDVASIKPSPPVNGSIHFGVEGGPGTKDPARMTGTHVTLSYLITTAYDVRRNQLEGAQQWMDSDMFALTAKVPDGATKEQAKVMLQNLLIDRFHLATHRETREMPIYALLVAKGGPKLSLAEPEPGTAPKEGESPAGPQRIRLGADGCPTPSSLRSGKGSMIFINGRACVAATRQTLDWLAQLLAPRVGRMIVNMTGLQGEYAFRLRFDPSGGAATMAPGRGGPDTTPLVREPDAEQFPDIFTAVQEQLGLKLESRKGPVELLVIDHLEKTPTEN